MADLNKGIQAVLFARYHFALEHYEPLATCRTTLVRLWVLRELRGTAERVAAFVPMEGHPGEERSAAALEDPIAAAAGWDRAVEAAEAALSAEEAAVDAARRALDPLREDLLDGYDHPTKQQDLAPAFLAAFHALWDGGDERLREALLPDALLAAFLQANLLRERSEGAALYEDALPVLQRLVKGGDLALSGTLSGTVFRASTSHRFAGDGDRARELQERGRVADGLPPASDAP